jgi:hypothetical protein
VLLQNLKSAQTRGVSMFEAFGFGKSIQKADDHSIVSRRR